MTISNDAAQPDFIDHFRRELARAPDRLFLTFDGKPVNFGMLADAARSAVHALFGDEPAAGKVVAVIADNSITSVALVLALAEAGSVWVPINPQLMVHGYRHVFEDAGPDIIVADSAYLGAAGEARTQAGISAPILSMESLSAGCSGGAATPPSRSFRGSDLFAFLYTSGTTGKPKAVKVTRHMMQAAANAVSVVAAVRPGDVMFMWEPVFHIGGAQMLILPMIHPVQLAMVPRFSASRFWSQVSESKATHIHYLGGVLQILLRQDPTEEETSNKVRIAWGAGCSADIWTEVETRFRLTVRECYGMTEASSVTTFNSGAPRSSVGKPLPWFEVSICNDNGAALAAGERGEIVVRELSETPQALFSGYHRNPQATAERLKDGLLFTGDIGSMDAEGNLYFHGRKTDSIRYRGQNISAWEIEHIVLKHPLVEECAAIGVQTEIGEEDIKLFVRQSGTEDLSADQMFAWLESNLPKFQVPRYIVFVDEFKKTGSARIMKHLLRDLPLRAHDRTIAGAK